MGFFNTLLGFDPGDEIARLGDALGEPGDALGERGGARESSGDCER